MADAVTRLARDDGSRVLAILARRYSDLDLADDAVQNALVAAVESWPTDGIPDNPAAWLFTVANRKAIDALRRARSTRSHLLAAAPELARAIEEDAIEEDPRMELIRDDTFVGDEQLRLLLLCCHPALDSATQVALTLRLVGGLTTPEIAEAYLVPESTLAQRIVRAKNKIRAAGMPLSIPADLNERVGSLLTVLYLIFNEGYLSRGATSDPIRIDLVDESIRLARLADELIPGTAEIEGLLALQLFSRARIGARTDTNADLVLLADQNRSLWDRDAIHEANALIAKAMARMHAGRFQVEALIAAHHANATSAATTPWAAIERLYGLLEAMTESPVVALNRAVAVAMTRGPAAGMSILDGLPGLDGYHLLHSTRAELALMAGDREEAEAAFVRALALVSNSSERRHLVRRLDVVRNRVSAPRSP